jgi:hypothetical protein
VASTARVMLARAGNPGETAAVPVPGLAAHVRLGAGQRGEVHQR